MDYNTIFDIQNHKNNSMLRKEGFKGQRTIVVPEFILNEIKKEALNQSLYITDIGYYPNAREHYRIRKEGSSQNILLYCVSGEGWISIDGKRVVVKANQYFIIPQKTAHSYGSNKHTPWTIYWVHFAGTNASLFANTINEAGSIRPSDISRINERNLLFEEMIQNLEMGFSIDNITYANVCLLHYLSSFRYLSQYRQIQKEKEMDMVERSIRFMRENISQTISLEELAQNVDLSKSHFSMAFKTKTGRTPLDYLIHLKIQKACQLLDNTNLKINEISVKVGYEDPYYFSRLFKKIMDTSPIIYRKLLKG